ncbi:MAG: HD domain-containing phosphohydrolase [Nitrospirota bacterium]
METETETPTILVVDDDEGVQGFCRLLLRERGYRVLQARGCEAALRAAKTQPADLYLVDLTLPDGHGFELIERVREVNPQALILVITGDHTEELLLRSLQLGVKNYLVKPFTGDQLLQTIEQTLADDRRVKDRIRMNVLTPLFELSENFLAEINLKTTFQQIVKMAKEQTRADVVSLMALDEAANVLTIEAAAGLPPEVVATTRLRPGERIAGWVASMKEPLILLPGIVPHQALRAFMARAELTASLCVPLLRKGKVIGVLNISKKQPAASFSQGDIELVSVICRQAAILIDNVRLFNEVSEKMAQLEGAHFDTIKALAGALESKDLYTRHHSDRTVEHADLIGRRLGLSERDRLHTRYAAILHDIGKIGIPERILNKPDTLTEEEFAIIKRHPAIGAAIVGHIEFLKPVIPLILHDHERWDGGGYPEGLRGEEIPLGSRIIAVVDAYDAMAVDRVYRRAPGHEHAVRELRRCAGTQFDPAVVAAFLDVLGPPPQIT